MVLLVASKAGMPLVCGCFAAGLSAHSDRCYRGMVRVTSLTIPIRMPCRTGSRTLQCWTHPETAHYLGYSMGDGIGFGIANHRPERFISLIIGGMHSCESTGALSPGAHCAAATRHGCVRSVRREAQRSHGSRPQGAALVQRPQAPHRSLQAPVSDGAEQLLPTMTMPCLLYVGEADSYYPGALEGVKKIPKRPLCLGSWGLITYTDLAGEPSGGPAGHAILQQVAQQEHAARR